MAYSHSHAARTVEPRSGPPPLGSRHDDLGFVLREANHRVRNLLAMMEIVIGETDSTSIEEYRARVMRRIAGMGDFFEVICHADDQMVDLAEMLARTVVPYDAIAGRVRTNGPEVEIGARLALMLHLVFHELATNAIKYGALSSLSGSVDVTWNVRRTSATRQTLAIIWIEQGGPQVDPPQCRGFGSRLITRALREHGQVYLDFERTGVACYMLIELDRHGGVVC